MLMTAFQAVITHLIAFAAVHDSFWTHASDMDLLNKITREQFVLLHDKNLLQELVEYWRKLYPGLELPDPPEPGKLDINDVKKSTYFFS
jgi:DNA-directed RNA polymerase